MIEDKKKTKIVAIKLDQAEIALRIVEGLTDSERPSDRSARDCLNELDDDKKEGLFRASRAIAEYLFEQITASGVEDAEFIEKPHEHMN